MEYILMDLDGTLTNSKEGITKCLQYALEYFGVQIDNLNSLEKYIGPPLEQTFREGFGFGKEQAEVAIDKYRERYVTKGMYENRLYAGMEDALQRLKESGKVLIVATSKPEKFAITILKHFGIDGYFDDICGADPSVNRNEKEEVIRYALEKHELTDLSDVLMVGDRKYDVEGARECGLLCMGVLYGFGSREELEEAGAEYIAETVEDMVQLLISL